MRTTFEQNINVDRLIDSLSHEPSSTIVALWGASGSGKSTLAEFISQQIPECTVFPIDRYLSPNLSWMNFNHLPSDGDVHYIEGLDPNIWDQALLNKHLARIAMMRPVDMPVFDHASRVRVGHDSFTPSKITIVEGAYAMENDIRQSIDKRVLIKSPLHDRFIRKLLRTSHVSQKTDIDESMVRYLERTEPAANLYYEKYTPSADFIINNPSSPRVEFSGYTKQKLDENHTRIHYLQPYSKFGTLHDGERVGIKNLGAESGIFCYNLDGKMLLHTNIGERALHLLNDFYTSI